MARLRTGARAVTRPKSKPRRKSREEERRLARQRTAKPKPPGHVGMVLDAVANRTIYAERIMGRLFLGDVKDGFTQRSIHQRRFAGLTSIHGIEWGLRFLVEAGHLRTTRIVRGGRPLVVFHLQSAGHQGRG